MAITDEQAKILKEQITKQIESTFPEDRKTQALSYVNNLDNNQLEEFIVKNKLIKTSDESVNRSQNPAKTQECIYCMLSSKKIESLPIYEDNDYISVLEINPYTKGHLTLIPKKHIKEAKNLPAKAFTLAKKIGSQVIKKLKAESYQITSSDELGHAIINIIPSYKNQPITYERKHSSPDELKELAMTIGKIEKKSAIPRQKREPKEKTEKQTESKAKLPQLPRRIP